MTDDEVVAYLAGTADLPPGHREGSRLERSRSLLAEPDLWAEPSPDLEQRIVDAVAGIAAGAPAQEAESVDVRSISAQRERRASRRLWVAVLGAAAAVLLVVGVAAVVNSQRTRPAEFAATVSGTDLAPGAKGSVTMTKTASGWRIHLQAKGLPRLDNGRYYEAWLKNAAGTLVPIGTFNQGDDVTLWSGVAPTDYPTITVTRQSADAGPASSGQKVLLGATHRTH